MSKLLIGIHASIVGGFAKALYQGSAIGATTVQIFTANQRRWDIEEKKPSEMISSEELKLWENAKKETFITTTMSHSGYLINLGSPDEEIQTKSKKTFKNEIKRNHLLKIDFLNFHPGAATGSSEEFCLERIVKNILSLESEINKGDTKLLIETTAGQGSCVGYTFEQLAYLIGALRKKIPIGVCIDTCHIFSAGYDIRTKEGVEDVFKKFDNIVGFENLYAFHVNDSLYELGSKKDRHANLGFGKIGIKSFEILMQHEKIRKMPKYLETPDETLWEKEILLLKKFGEK